MAKVDSGIFVAQEKKMNSIHLVTCVLIFTYIIKKPIVNPAIVFLFAYWAYCFSLNSYPPEKELIIHFKGREDDFSGG